MFTNHMTSTYNSRLLFRLTRLLLILIGSIWILLKKFPRLTRLVIILIGSFCSNKKIVQIEFPFEEISCSNRILLKKIPIEENW